MLSRTKKLRTLNLFQNLIFILKIELRTLPCPLYGLNSKDNSAKYRLNLDQNPEKLNFELFLGRVHGSVLKEGHNHKELRTFRRKSSKFSFSGFWPRFSLYLVELSLKFGQYKGHCKVGSSIFKIKMRF